MRINYNVMTKHRQWLKNAIVKEFNVTVKYHGSPTWAYKFKYDGSMYTIDRFGLLYGADNHDLVARLRDNHGFIAIAEHYDDPSPKTPESTAADRESGVLTIEIPLDGFTTKGISNLYKIVKSNEHLIKKSLRINDLSITQTETSFKFPWFKIGIDNEQLAIYTDFITALCNTAKNQIRARNIERGTDNEKYAFRAFLTERLGFVGDGYKAHRKLLLANLTGDAAYRDKQHRRYKFGVD